MRLRFFVLGTFFVFTVSIFSKEQAYVIDGKIKEELVETQKIVSASMEVTVKVGADEFKYLVAIKDAAEKVNFTTAKNESCQNYLEASNKKDDKGGWYLPDRIVLVEIYKALKDNGNIYTSFVKSDSARNYWSSSESSTNIAWGQGMSYGLEFPSHKEEMFSVRCVRAL